jgi:hypothetical protein
MLTDSKAVADVRPRDVFMFGAGFSKAIDKRMPTLPELSRAIFGRLQQHAKIAGVPFISENIEMAMTFLSQPQPWMTEAERLRNRACFLELTEAIASEIENDAKLARASSCPDWLVKFVHWLHLQKAVVITLNYDTLLEDAFVEIPGIAADPKHLVPFRFAADEGVLRGGDVSADSLELLKLHGSTNWRYSGSTSYSGELIQWSQVHGWTNRFAGLTNREKNSDTVPLIIPPVADKAGYFAHHSVRYLWRRAAYALRVARRVFCIGYSLPTTDLTMRFLMSDSAPPSAVEFYLVNFPNMDDGTSIEQHFRDILPKSLCIENRFVGSTKPIPAFVEALFTDEYLPDLASPAEQPPGQVQSAIRDRVREGQAFQAALNAGYCVADGFYPNSIALLLGEPKIRVRIPWESLERVVSDLENLDKAERQRVPAEQFDGLVRRVCDCDRQLGPWIAALLEVAGLVTIWRDCSRWMVSPAGANADEVARFKQSAQA